MDVEDHTVVKSDEEELAHPANQSISSHLLVDDHLTSSALRDISAEGRLSFRETARLSFEFCLLWVGTIQHEPRTVLIFHSFSYVMSILMFSDLTNVQANYFIAACLEYTTVASSTILTSTSSISVIFWSSAGQLTFIVRYLDSILRSFTLRREIHIEETYRRACVLGWHHSHFECRSYGQ